MSEERDRADELQREKIKKLISSLGSEFGLEGSLESVDAIEVGHINSTYKVVFSTLVGERLFYVFQRLNPTVFPKPEMVMNNVRLVTEHIHQLGVESGQQALMLFPSVSGKAYYVDADGDFWRCYNFIKEAHSVDVVENESQAYEAAKGFGGFLEMMSNFDITQLGEVIEDFHHTPKRLHALREAVEEDRFCRAITVQKELDFILSREELCLSLQKLRDEGAVPVRVTHNDTKMNNVMLSNKTGEAVCVIDLDTVMPGLSLYDFGDLVRTSVSPAQEDESVLNVAAVRMPMFKSLVKGFLAGCPSLTELEKRSLVLASKAITLEVSIRFLTDFLNGDEYFKTCYPEHNLVRCRNHHQLLRLLEANEEEMEKVVLELI